MISFAVFGHWLTDSDVGLLHARYKGVWVKWFDPGINADFAKDQMAADPPNFLVTPPNVELDSLLQRVPAGKRVVVVKVANPVVAISRIAQLQQLRLEGIIRL